jgi:vancomycin resistance protein YoaR
VSIIKLISGKSTHSGKAGAQGRAPLPRKKIELRNRAVGKQPGAAARAADRPFSAEDKRKRLLLISLIAAAALCAAFAGIGAYAQKSDVIYPKTTLDGVPVGSLTAAQAADALIAANVDTLEDRTLKVSLPAGCEMHISGKLAGVYLSAPDAAQYAWDHCHGGSFFGNTWNYIKSLLGGTDLKSADGAKLDEAYLKKQVEEAAGKVALALANGSVKVGDDAITVVKGASTVTLDQDALYAAVKKALLDGSYKDLSFTATKSGGKTTELDLQELYDSVYTEPKNAEYDSSTHAATESVQGRSFDMAVAKKLWDEAKDGDLVTIPLILTDPEITTEKLNSMLFATVLAQKSTSLAGSSAARINNITKAAASINGIILNPGEEFSYNAALGQRTRAAGYQAAGAYSGGQVVQEVGGGICQVSSTLYYCALIANLTITSRTCHYFGVNYLPTGLDATVSWPSPDFKFKNSSEYPIKIVAGVQGGSVTVQIYGSNPDGITVKMTTETFKNNDTYGATSYRWVYDRNGNLISKTKEASSTYHYHTSTATPTPSAAAPTTAPPSATATPAPSQATETPPETAAPVEPAAA